MQSQFFFNIRVCEGTQGTPGTSRTHAYAVLNKHSKQKSGFQEYCEAE